MGERGEGQNLPKNLGEDEGPDPPPSRSLKVCRKKRNDKATRCALLARLAELVLQRRGASFT